METLASLQARGDLYTRQLINERQRIAQLQSKLAEVNQNIVSTRESNKAKAIQLLNINNHATKYKAGSPSTTKSNKTKLSPCRPSREANTRADGLNPTKTAMENQRKMIKSLEGRLNLALTRRNSIQTENNVIKEKINMLRRKICNDNTNRDSIEKELRAIQERMGEIMSRAAVASEQTGKIEEQRNQMLKHHMEGEEAFREEYERLSAYVAEQARLLGESIATVANDVVAASGSGSGSAANVKQSRRSSATASGAIEADGDTQNGVAYLYEIRLLEDKLRQLDADYEATRRHLEITDESIRTNEAHLRRLRDISGLDSIDDIIEAFVRHEDEAFSLFCYIQALNQEIDETMEENSRIEHELEASTRRQRRQESQRAAVVGKYKDALKEAEEERRQMNTIAREGRQTVQKIAANVQGLYFKLRCRQLEAAANNGTGRATPGSSSSSASLEGADKDSSCSSHKNTSRCRPQLPIADRKLTIATGEEISERNILHHMELIEKRTCEIIASYAKRLASSKARAQRRPSVIMVSSGEQYIFGGIPMCCQVSHQKTSILLLHFFLFPSPLQSPKLFQLQARTPFASTEEGDNESDASSSESDEDSSDEDEDGGRPVSVQDIWLEAAALVRPKSASGASQSIGLKAMRSMTPPGAAGAPPNPKTRNTII